MPTLMLVQTYRGERTFPPASRRSSLNVTEDNQIPIDLSGKKSRRSLLDSGTWSDPVLERRSCSSSLTRPTSPGQKGTSQNRRTGTDSDLYSRLPLMEI